MTSWQRIGDNYHLSYWWPSFLTDICVTTPQRVDWTGGPETKASSNKIMIQCTKRAFLYTTVNDRCDMKHWNDPVWVSSFSLTGQFARKMTMELLPIISCSLKGFRALPSADWAESGRQNTVSILTFTIFLESFANMLRDLSYLDPGRGGTASLDCLLSRSILASLWS